MSDYGLPSQRDNEGNLKAVDHEFEYQDQTVAVKLYPPTVSQLEDYEEFGDETGTSELADVVDEHIVKPEIEDRGDLTIRELLCYVEGIVDYGASGGTDFVEEAREELEARQDEEGN